MAGSQVFHGARAKLGIYDPASGLTRIVGLFNNVSFGLSYEVQEAYILGKHAPAATTYTAQNPVNITASGYRVIQHGPHVEAGLPRLQDLLLAEYIELTIIDRQTEALGGDSRVYKFHDVRPTGYSTTISARQQTELSMTFIGILVDDESVTNAERPDAAVLPG